MRQPLDLRRVIPGDDRRSPQNAHGADDDLQPKHHLRGTIRVKASVQATLLAGTGNAVGYSMTSMTTTGVARNSSAKLPSRDVCERRVGRRTRQTR